MLVLHWSYLKDQCLLKCIVILNFLSEAFSLIPVMFDAGINEVYNFSIILHCTFWQLMLVRTFKYTRKGYLILVLFWVFALYNLVFGEGFEYFNSNTFIVGSFIYLIVFIIESFKQLKRENFPFFLSQSYWLISAPILFFLGFSFLFGFKSHSLGEVVLFYNVTLHDFISAVVNTVFYFMLNMYIYMQKNKKNAS